MTLKSLCNNLETSQIWPLYYRGRVAHTDSSGSTRVPIMHRVGLATGPSRRTGSSPRVELLERSHRPCFHSYTACTGVRHSSDNVSPEDPSTDLCRHMLAAQRRFEPGRVPRSVLRHAAARLRRSLESQLPHKTVNLTLQSVIVNNKLTILWGS